MGTRTAKDLLWEWVEYLDVCAMHGSLAPPCFPPLTYQVWVMANTDKRM